MVDGGWPIFGAYSDDYRNQLFDNCIRTCDEMYGTPKLPAQPPDAEEVICMIFIIADVVTVPSGEGVAPCATTKTVFKTVRKCFRRGFRKKCELLKAAKEAACNASHGKSCGSPPLYKGLSGNECHAREILHLACATARATYQAVCFKKGATNPKFPGHKEAISSALAAAKNCGACAAAKP
jgi:hypothetical protein